MPRKLKTDPHNTTDYVAYYRVSDHKQGESGLGLEAQRSAVTRYLAGVKGQLVAEYTEIESGKKHTNRPELLAAIAASKRSRATLLIAKLDRLARNVHFISGLMESAADFVACDMPAANKLTLHIMAAMAEHEREMISGRTRAGLAEVKRELEEKGFRISRRSGKLFHKLGNPRWEECIAKARAARKTVRNSETVLSLARELRVQGKPLRAIASELNLMGLKTASGAVWHPSTVRALLLEDQPEAPKPQLPADTLAILRERHSQGESLRAIAAALNGLGLKTASGAAWHPSSVRQVLLPAKIAA